MKSPSGKRAASERTTRKVEIRAGQTRSSGVSTSSGHEPGERERRAAARRARSRRTARARPTRAARVLRRPPSARLRREADDRRPDAEVEHREVDRDRADERPDAELDVADLVQHDRRDDEPRDDRGRVDRVDAERVAAEEPHQAADVGDDVEVRGQRAGRRGRAASGTRRSSARAGAVQEPDRAAALRRGVRAQRDLDVRAEQHREAVDAVPPPRDDLDRRPLRVVLEQPPQAGVRPAPVGPAARGGRPARRASRRARGRRVRSRGAARALPAPGRRSARAPACRGRGRTSRPRRAAPRPARRGPRPGCSTDVDAHVLARALGEEGVVRLRPAADVEDAVASPCRRTPASSSHAASGARTSPGRGAQPRPSPLLAGPVATAHVGTTYPLDRR